MFCCNSKIRNERVACNSKIERSQIKSDDCLNPIDETNGGSFPAVFRVNRVSNSKLGSTLIKVI